MAENPKKIQQGILFGVRPGTGYLRERIAYLLDKKSGRHAGVPLTKIASFEKKYFYDTRIPVVGTLTGSFQKWINHAHVAVEDYQILPSGITTAQGYKIPNDQIHKIAIFDIRTLNCDRHLQNFLISQDRQIIYPIDHGYTYPKEAGSLRFDWIRFPQAKKPFSPNMLKHIGELDPMKDIDLIKRKFPQVHEDTLQMVKLSIRLLQIAAKRGLTAYQIGDLFMRRKHSAFTDQMLNIFIPVPSREPSYFQNHIAERIRAYTYLNVEQLLQDEVTNYIQPRRPRA